MVTSEDVKLVAEAGDVADVKELGLQAMRDGDKDLALFLLRCVNKGEVDRTKLLVWCRQYDSTITLRDAWVAGVMADPRAQALVNGTATGADVFGLMDAHPLPKGL